MIEILRILWCDVPWGEKAGSAVRRVLGQKGLE